MIATACTITMKMVRFLPTIITGGILLLISPAQNAAASKTDRGAIHSFKRGGASIDGNRNKRFNLNPLKSSQLDRRRRHNINDNRSRNEDVYLNRRTDRTDTSISRNAKGNSNGSGRSMSMSPPRTKKVKMYVTLISIVALWLGMSTLFYAKFYSWPYPQVSHLMMMRVGI